MTPIQNPEVAAKFESYPPKAKKAMLALRTLVLATARTTPVAIYEVAQGLINRVHFVRKP
jgi:hypothetical protein